MKVNTVDHNTFQEQINSYLQGRPDDAFMWFAGYRMQFFAQRGLATDISDVWGKIGGNFSDALKNASTGLDGKQYFVPFYYYPWALFYRKSVFEENGYEVPETLDDLKALATKMKSDGLSPIGFADKDGWPAMGTFDILNLRINGYDFHMQLMKGEASWQDPKVAKVFDTWRELLPFHQQGALGRTWQEAAKGLSDKKSGMYLLGMFVGQQFSEADREDLDFFAFPEIDSDVGADTLDAPIDGFMLSKDPENEEGAKALLEFLAGPEAQNTYLANDPNNIATNDKADTSAYSALQKKAVELVVGRVEHHAVHGPRHAAGLRLDGDDPGAAGLHQEPGRRRRAHQEDRGPEEDHLHLVTVVTEVTDGARGPEAQGPRQPASAAPTRPCWSSCAASPRCC